MKKFFSILIMLLTLLSASAAEVERAMVTDSVESTMLPELNIVSIKQAGSLQNQAVSATVINIGEVQLNDITDIKRLSDLVPNFYIPDYGSRITSTIYVRGIGARMDQPSVGLTVDNLPVLNKDAYDLDIADIAEIEMLRGPQSSLYGRNTMTGLINIRTLSPLRYQGFRIMGEAMLNNSYKLQGGWFHKFRPDMGFSVSLALNSLRTGYKNSYNNSDVGREKSGAARVKFEWLPTSRFSILNTFSTSLLKQSGYAYEYVGTKEINYNDTCFYKRFLLNDALTLNYNFPSWKITGILSVQHINDNMTLDQDFLPESYFTLTQKKQETDLTAEFIAHRNPGHPYHWLGGIFAFYRHLDMQAPVIFKPTGIASLIELHRNESNPYYPIKWDSDEFLLNSDFKLPSFGLAAYHESRYKTGNLEFSASVRLDFERINLNYHSFTATSYTVYENPSGILPAPFDKLKFYRQVAVNIDEYGKLHTVYLTFLPKASALYNLPSGIGNLYATFGKGYKAGGYNVQMFSDVLQQRLMNFMGATSKYNVDDLVRYKPEYSYNYEIGGHLDFGGLSNSPLANLSADLSIFYIDCRDQQLTKFPEGVTTGRMMTNAGRTRSFGAELALSWNPWEPLRFNGSYGYTNARFVNYNDGREDFKGKRLPYAPANTLFLQCIYSLQNASLGNKSIIFDVNMRGTGDIYWDEANSLRQPFYALLGGSVSLKTPKWEVQIWGKNLTATRYNTFYFMSISHEFLQRGAKINAGVIFRLTI